MADLLNGGYTLHDGELVWVHHDTETGELMFALHPTRRVLAFTRQRDGVLVIRFGKRDPKEKMRNGGDSARVWP